MSDKHVIDECTQCGGRRFRVTTSEDLHKVGDLLVKVQVPTTECVKCGEGFTHLRDLRHGQLVAAGELARGGPIHSAGFKFMRQALRMAASELAELLDVAPGTVSRWENGVRPPDRGAWLVLGSLVLDRLAGTEATLERLRALDRRRKARIIRVEAESDA